MNPENSKQTFTPSPLPVGKRVFKVDVHQAISKTLVDSFDIASPTETDAKKDFTQEILQRFNTHPNMYVSGTEYVAVLKRIANNDIISVVEFKK